jgi:uncharacterized membrane protein
VSFRFLIADVDLSRPRTILVWIGAIAFCVGIIFMFYHLQAWQSVGEREKDRHVRVFEWRKFRRRTTIAALISGCGSIMTATYWIAEPRIFFASIVVIMAVLVAIFILACFDLLSVGMHHFSKIDRQAHEEMLKKSLELHKKKKEQERDHPE